MGSLLASKLPSRSLKLRFYGDTFGHLTISIRFPWHDLQLKASSATDWIVPPRRLIMIIMSPPQRPDWANIVAVHDPRVPHHHQHDYYDSLMAWASL